MSSLCKFYLKFPVTQTYYTANYPSSDLKKGDEVVAEIEGLGKEILYVTGHVGNPDIDFEEVQIIKKADSGDLMARDEAKIKEDELYPKVKAAIEKEKFNLSLVDVHLGPLTNILTIFYTAAEMVDFRNFVKNAYQNVGYRVNMRQLRKQREPGKFFSGCGICGRKTCCSTSACCPERCNVSVKTLKEQNLMPNSAKNVGLCGFLCCCMSYEADYYKDAKSIFPKIGDEVQQGNKKFKVCDINYISSKIKLENRDELSVLVVNFNELEKNEENKWSVVSEN